MSQITVTPQTMISLAENIIGKIEEWNNAVQKIYSLQHEMDAMWDGTANDAFNMLFEEDSTKFRNLAQVMMEYANAIKVAANRYITAEQEVKGIVSKR